MSASSNASTPIQLFYDLCIVTSVSLITHEMGHCFFHEGLFENIILYLFVFWAIFWLWANFTWFAARHEMQDNFYYIVVFFQIISSLVIAYGITPIFRYHDFQYIMIGYSSMRFFQILLWLRVIFNKQSDKNEALIYTFGIGLCQFGWFCSVMYLSSYLLVFGFCIMLILEHLVPIYADRKKIVNWRKYEKHLIERHELLMLIILGESMVIMIYGIKQFIQIGGLAPLKMLLTGFVFLFTVWWLYFLQKKRVRFYKKSLIFLWGYGHYFLFVSTTFMSALLYAFFDNITFISNFEYQNYIVILPYLTFLIALWLFLRKPPGSVAESAHR